MFNKKFFWVAINFLLPFIVYIKTLAPDVFFVDAGELATACAKLCIAHPTGYPLFTILGKVFALLPYGQEVYVMNVVTAFYTAISISIYFFFSAFLIRLVIFFKNHNTSKTSNKLHLENYQIYFIATVSALILAFSRTWWDTATSIEVYNLHKIFLVLLIFTLYKAIFNQFLYPYKEDNKEKYWILFAFLLGLSFGNHLSTLFLSIGVIYLYFAYNGFSKISFIRILILAIPFLAGLSIYIYLFLRAESAPISWGYPHNWENFIRHVSGKQFSVWMFKSIETMKKQFVHFVSIYPIEFSIPLFFLIIIGIIKSFISNYKLFFFQFLLFAFSILYGINYDIYDIDSYFLLAFLVSSMWILYALLFFVEIIKKYKLQFSFIYILSILPLLPLITNYSSNDESDNYYVKDYMFNVFNSAKPNSIIMSTQWDFWVSASWYYQYVKGIRPDVIVIDKELLRRMWYLRHIKIHFPIVYERTKKEFDAYEAELIKFEKYTDRYLEPKTDFDKKELEKIRYAFLNFLNALVDNFPDKNFYTTYDIEDVNVPFEKFGKDYVRLPEGLLVRYSKQKEYDSNYVDPDYKIRITNSTIYYYEFLMRNYYRALLYRVNYLMNYEQYDKAEELLKIATDIEKGSDKNIKPHERQTQITLKKIKELRELKNQK
ncbi:MAG: DUF2723 domain-containing protein [Ignavibacteria bacterium]|nr:DUF2723 domain-containing protein [Ignavibacteria bacterium]